MVAFSNTRGGRIIFGVLDDRTVVGFPDDVLFSKKDVITNQIMESCIPAVNPEIYPLTVDGKDVIVVYIPPGISTPYRLKDDGPGQVYVRVSGTSRVADPRTVKELELRGMNRSFDGLDYPAKQVVREELDALCRRLSGLRLEITPAKLENMGVVRRDDHGFAATYAYAYLTDNGFFHTRIMCACFLDPEGTEFEDSIELDRDIVSQIDDAMAFVRRNIRMRSEVNGVVRDDLYEVPMKAVREALINAVVHRSYVLDDSRIFLRIYPDRVSIESPGLPLGLDISDPLEGHSVQRNKVLASVFRSIGLMEEFGTGIRRMFKECRAGGYADPEFSERDVFFTVTFRRGQSSRIDVSKPEISAWKPSGLNRTQKQILGIMAQNPDVTMAEIASRLGISERQVRNAVSYLKTEGFLTRDGTRRSGKWNVMRNKA